MQALLETIKCLDGQCFNLPYHLKRINTSRQRLGFDSPLELSLTPPKKGLFRCRLVYENEILKIEYLPYEMKLPHSFKLIHTDISYDLKYEDRDELNTLVGKKEDADEIIIVKDGLVTDTSIANLCFFDAGEWLTPSKPLLNGTTRQRLLDEKKIITADIHFEKIHTYSKIAVMNAMTDFQIIENAIIR